MTLRLKILHSTFDSSVSSESMKTMYRFTTRTILTLLVLLLVRLSSFSQGKVVLNEYLTWPSNGCGVGSEFIELLNFGPGPMNIGCYIVTNGSYSVTIPANTILQPGQFYLMAGMNTIASGCANIDSAVHPDLNWYTCNCTSAAIPTTGDGFMTDGGSANVHLVLLDPNLNVIDAVTRTSPPTSSSLITTSNMGGNCVSKSFDLDLLTINYESLGMSDGRGNSNARQVDGDCGWVKETQQSANATNNTAGHTSSISYSLAYITAMACPIGSATGSVIITANNSSVYPISYTLAYDLNNNGSFDIADQYTTGTDSTSSDNVPINNLVAGYYRITLSTASSCYLQSIDFIILDCLPLLSVQLLSFDGSKIDGKLECKWSLAHTEFLDRIDIEKSSDGINFQKVASVEEEPASTGKKDFRYLLPDYPSDKIYLRLAIYNKDGKVQWSSVIVFSNKDFSVSRVWPNPVHEELNVEINSDIPKIVNYKIFDYENHIWTNGKWRIQKGANIKTVPVTSLPNGFYRLLINNSSSTPPTQHTFIKL